MANRPQDILEQEVADFANLAIDGADSVPDDSSETTQHTPSWSPAKNSGLAPGAARFGLPSCKCRPQEMEETTDPAPPRPLCLLLLMVRWKSSQNDGLVEID